MGQQKLGWLEFGRGAAAMVVVISHAALAGAPPSMFVWSGVYAVAFFFVLSGFIILYVHAGDIDRPKAAPAYLWRRLIRIFPTYWLMLFVALALRAATMHDGGTANVTVASIAHDLFLLPGGEPIVQVAWTLRHELLFYGMFLALILNARIGTILFAAWLIAILYTWVLIGPLYWVSDATRPPLQTVLSPINLFFFPGLALAATARRWPFKWLADLRPPSFSYWMGRLSYPLYLSHWTIYYVTGGVLKRIGVVLPWPIYLPIVIFSSMLLAWLIANLFEAPVLSRLRRLGHLKRGFSPRNTRPAISIESAPLVRGYDRIPLRRECAVDIRLKHIPDRAVSDQ